MTRDLCSSALYFWAAFVGLEQLLPPPHFDHASLLSPPLPRATPSPAITFITASPLHLFWDFCPGQRVLRGVPLLIQST